MFTAETGRKRVLLEGIVDGRLFLKKYFKVKV
jgi:hypothetical protein